MPIAIADRHNAHKLFLKVRSPIKYQLLLYHD